MEPLLQRMSKEDANVLFANSEKMEFTKGETIYNEGDSSDYLYFIHTGEIRLFKRTGPNKELTIFTRRRDDAFGEVGVFSSLKYSNTAEAVMNSVLYRIENQTLENILTDNGGIGLHFTRWVAESLEASKAKIRDYIAFGSEGAVASVFIRYSNMYGVVTPEGVRITEPIMIQDISKHIGISRETVSRIVNKWKERGIIDNDNKYFLLKKVDYFKELLVCEQCGVENCVL
ncbi:Crp/Fnr family transcriptional regulator [Virgibacillus ihumii]|uniref:Crp/Fnr family transcriptional regulator n=1 Tax=Virgibacillus ihumii TaxID=2686091 RepID=UPI00157BFA3E|nr:Crp/Fnr family transcriptional regulator [Virgibacillus ihumii]